MTHAWRSYSRLVLDHLPLVDPEPNHQWRRSLAWAIGIHLLVLLTALATPYLFHYQPRLPEIYTVNLFNVSEAPQPVSRPAAAARPALVTPRKLKKKPAVTKPPPPPKTATSKAVSTRPVRVKTRQDLERFERLRQAIKAEEQARQLRQEAERRAKEALAALRQSLATRQPAPTATNGDTTPQPVAPTATGQGGVSVDAATRRYLIAVNNRIQAHWSLPELQNWPDDLEAVLVIRVRRDGIVSRSFFERKSRNVYFNQFVEKAIQEAAPLPPFPAELKQPEMEIGLRFRPGKVF